MSSMFIKDIYRWSCVNSIYLDGISTDETSRYLLRPGEVEGQALSRPLQEFLSCLY